MKVKSNFHIFLQSLCLVLTLHFIALSIGGVYYLHLFLPKEKVVSLINKVETEKDSDASNKLPEPDDDEDYQNVGILIPSAIFEKSPFIEISTYHSSLSLFSEYSSKTLMGFSDVIFQPPQV
jgi:protoporphyrinogen oxidase